MVRSFVRFCGQCRCGEAQLLLASFGGIGDGYYLWFLESLRSLMRVFGSWMKSFLKIVFLCIVARCSG